MKKDNMKTAMRMSGLLVALLAAAVPALAAETGQRERSANNRQAVSTQAQAGSTQTQTQTRTGTRYSGGRQAVSTQAQTGTRDPGVNQRQQNQQQRIQQGSRQGDLTRNEARGLQNQARDVRREEHAFRSDGRFTPGERRHVQRDLDRVSRDIHRERNDGNRRFGDNNGWRGNHYGWQGQGSTRAFDRRVDRIEHNQRERIQQGIRSGELTRYEAQRLMSEQRRIEAEERRYMADGVLTQWERMDLTRDLNAAGQHIYNQTHDAQARR